jgi:TolB-like protein/Tfp pilus assembly protein PilF
MDTAEKPVRVYTLGGFKVLRDGAPLAFGAKAQHQPLALLKVLIALGGDQVPEQTLTDALWPDSEGDAARSTFATTLHRLRLLIGREALVLRDRRLSLDPAQCWVDALEFQQRLTAASRTLAEGRVPDVIAEMERATALYRAPFLEGEFDPPEVLSARERLHGLLLRHIGEIGTWLWARGERDAAIALYQRAIEIDDTTEELYRRLMETYAETGRHAEALALYERCRAILRAKAGIEPSPETEAVHQALTTQRRQAPQAAQESARGYAADPGQEAAGGKPPTLAVLPLINLSGDPALDYFCDGLAEDLITDLSQYDRLKVVAHSSSFRYKGRSVDVRAIGKELGVCYVLEGSVRSTAGQERLRVTVQLADTVSGMHLWAERFDRETKDIFAVQEEIVDRVSVALDVRLIEGAQAVSRRRSARSYEAYRLFRRGNELFEKRTEADTHEAIKRFHEALALDPNFVAPWMNLGWCYEALVENGWSESEAEHLNLAENYADKALALDPGAVEALGLLGFVYLYQDKIDLAIEVARRATELEPKNADAVGMYADVLGAAGRIDEAISMMDRAIALAPDPAAWMYGYSGGWFLLMGKHEKALEFFQKSLSILPDYLFSRILLAVALSEIGQMHVARAEIEQIRRIEARISLNRLPRIYGALRYPMERYRKALQAAGMRE